jgi:hypothetical protein
VRLSDADRELLYERLSRHAAAGRLGVEELERRVAAIDVAETREQAAEVMSDLPPLQSKSSSPRRASHGEAPAPDPEWRETTERFRDPSSGQVMRVWVDAAGGRHYVVDE